MTYSVVIPSYNHAAYLRDAVLSAINQTMVPAEIIIIDDGSTDQSLKICHELEQQYPIVRVISQTNKGAHNAINSGLALAQSDYIAILNSDDIYSLDRFENLFKVPTTDWDLIGSDLQLIDGNSRDLGVSMWLTKAKVVRNFLGNSIFSLAYANYFMSTSNFLFKKSLIKEIGYFSDFRYCHDLDFLIRVSERK